MHLSNIYKFKFYLIMEENLAVSATTYQINSMVLSPLKIGNILIFVKFNSLVGRHEGKGGTIAQV